MNVFLPPIEEYKRNYDIIGSYKINMAKVLSLATGTPYQATYKFVEKRFKEKKWLPNPPKMRVLRRKPGQDRKKAEIDLLSYLKWIEINNHILAPSFVCYANPNMFESFLSGFIESNLKNRKAIKTAGQTAEMSGDKEYAKFCDLLQSNAKIRNNSISGALSSPYNPLYYASSHPSLTSTCRGITSYANACNEKFMASNRHYYSPDVTIENIAYITSAADLGKVMIAMDLYNISAPTVEYTYELILNSTRMYWRDEAYESVIKTMVENMTDLERAGFCFIGDLNALHETNDPAVRRFYGRLLEDPKLISSKEEQDALCEKVSDDDKVLVSLLCMDFMKGKKPKDLAPKEYQYYTSKIKHVSDVFLEYKSFIEAFISNKIMPGSIHSLPTIIRKTVVGSDTDSSIFSTQRQVNWFTGNRKTGNLAIKTGAITAYMASQLIVHTLAKMSAQMGVRQDQLFLLSMKSEIYSQGMINTGVTKTYALDETAKEGNLYSTPKIVIKGVLLKSSKLPSRVRSEIEKFTKWCLLEAPTIDDGISPLEVASIVAFIEHKLKKHLLSGHSEFFKTEQIKTPQTYTKGEDDTKIMLKELWNCLFHDTYGAIENLPSDALKVNVDLSNKTKIAEYAEKLGNVKGKRLLNFCHKYERTSFTQILAPLDYLPEGKVPKEILEAMDLRKMLFSLMQPFYIVCNALSLNIANKNFTRFWSDSMTEEDALKYLPKDYVINLD